MDGGLSGIEFFDLIWYGVLYDFNWKWMLVVSRDLVMRLFIYVLGGVFEKMEWGEICCELVEVRWVGEDWVVDF